MGLDVMLAVGGAVVGALLAIVVVVGMAHASPKVEDAPLARIVALEDDVAELHDRFRRFQGRFYARLRLDNPEEQAESTLGKLAALREQYPTASDAFLRRKLGQANGGTAE